MSTVPFLVMNSSRYIPLSVDRYDPWYVIPWAIVFAMIGCRIDVGRGYVGLAARMVMPVVFALLFARIILLFHVNSVYNFGMEY